MNNISILEFCEKFQKSQWASVIKKLNVDFTIADVLSAAGEPVSLTVFTSNRRSKSDRLLHWV